MGEHYELYYRVSAEVKFRALGIALKYKIWWKQL